MNKVVGKVTEQERDEILRLFERKNGLAELAKILTPDNKELYERLVSDIGKNQIEFQKWWDAKGSEYGWESIPNGSWSINFDTCEISLTDE